jgi:hypothetical protein
MDKLIEKIYFDASHPAGFSGFTKLRKHLPRRVTSKAIQTFLLKQDSHTIHKPILRKFKRDVVFSTNIDDNWQVDLMDVRNIAKHNDGIKFILVVIDVFSKFLWARYLKNKSATAVRDALRDILQSSGRAPLTIQSDKGRELINKLVETYLRENDISIYSTENSDIKASVAERVIRTLKTKMYRIFTHKGNYRFREVLPDLVKAYNESIHRSIGMAPSDVDDRKVNEVWKRLYVGQNNVRTSKCELRIDDFVRISKTRRLFEKGYEGGWSREIFKVKNILRRIPTMYELVDWSGEPILGRFYGKELQRVLMPEYHKVDKVLRSRKVGNRTDYFVSWRGYPSSCNSWIKKQDLKK